MVEKLSAAVRRDLEAVVQQHSGKLYSGAEGAADGMRVRWNIAVTLEECGLTVLTHSDGKARVWCWEVTEHGRAVAGEAATLDIAS